VPYFLKSAGTLKKNNFYLTNINYYISRSEMYIEGKYMQIFKVEKRTSMLINQLLEVWEDSVRETHLFLSGSEIQSIKNTFPKP